MIAAALDAGVPPPGSPRDEVYGADPGLRADLEQRGIGYVLAVGCDRRVHVNDGRTRSAPTTSPRGSPPASGSGTVAGPGAKGPRVLLLGLDRPPPPDPVSTGGC